MRQSCRNRSSVACPILCLLTLVARFAGAAEAVEPQRSRAAPEAAVTGSGGSPASTPLAGGGAPGAPEGSGKRIDDTFPGILKQLVADADVGTDSAFESRMDAWGGRGGLIAPAPADAACTLGKLSSGRARRGELQRRRG